LKKLLDQPTVLGHDPCMMNTHASNQYLLDLRASTFSKRDTLEPLGNDRLAFLVNQSPPFEQLSNLPTLVSIETEY